MEVCSAKRLKRCICNVVVVFNHWRKDEDEEKDEDDEEEEEGDLILEEK